MQATKLRGRRNPLTKRDSSEETSTAVPRLRRVRILVANEPRAYRTALAPALQGLRPGAEVTSLEPEAIDREIERLAPDLVICSRATEAVRNMALSWIELHPDGAPQSVISVRGQRSKVPGLDLAGILATIDETERLLGCVSGRS